MKLRHAIPTVTAAALVTLFAGCQSRTAAYTQPTPATFDPASSDEQAVQIADEMIATLGGAETWNAVKQIRWEQRYMYQDELKGLFSHAWDRWNARHRFEQVSIATLKEAEKKNKPGLVKASVAMYDIYDPEGRATATYGGKQVIDSDAEEIVQTAREAFKTAHYQLAGYYKLKDPGVQLAHHGKSKDLQGYCKPECDIIQVTFAPEVGEDTYFIHVNSETKMPDIVASEAESGQLAYAIEEWTTVSGLKFPVAFQNLGLKGEKFKLENIRIGEPDDALYIPTVK